MSDTATTDTDVLFRDDVDDMEEMPTRRLAASSPCGLLCSPRSSSRARAS